MLHCYYYDFVVRCMYNNKQASEPCRLLSSYRDARNGAQLSVTPIVQPGKNRARTGLLKTKNATVKKKRREQRERDFILLLLLQPKKPGTLRYTSRKKGLSSIFTPVRSLTTTDVQTTKTLNKGSGFDCTLVGECLHTYLLVRVVQY